jgi:hypothetical protein
MVCLSTEPDALQHYNATHQIRVKRQVTIVLVSQAGGGASAFPGLLPQMRDGVEQQRTATTPHAPERFFPSGAF